MALSSGKSTPRNSTDGTSGSFPALGHTGQKVIANPTEVQKAKIEATAQVGSDDGTIVVIPEGETVRPMVVSDATENVNVG